MALRWHSGWHSDGTQMALRWHSDGTQMALRWHSDGAQKALRWRSDGARLEAKGEDELLQLRSGETEIEVGEGLLELRVLDAARVVRVEVREELSHRHLPRAEAAARGG